MTYTIKTQTKEDLELFVKTIPDLREDFHEASDSLIVQMIGGHRLDNEGFENRERSIRLISKHNPDLYTEINLATLLGMAMGHYE